MRQILEGWVHVFPLQPVQKDWVLMKYKAKGLTI